MKKINTSFAAGALGLFVGLMTLSCQKDIVQPMQIEAQANTAVSIEMLVEYLSLITNAPENEITYIQDSSMFQIAGRDQVSLKNLTKYYLNSKIATNVKTR